jgi:hydroxymethylpyrimidine/phosphomethylpyrimidine kinase
MRSAIDDLRGLGARAVLLQGGHLPDASSAWGVDLFADEADVHEITHPRLQLEAHGTGCTLASAVAANLCLQRDLKRSCEAAADYVHAALQRGYRPGRGEVLVLDHFGAALHG